MAGSIKIRANAKNDVTTVKCLMKHDMETGTRRNSETGDLIKAHYIQEVSCTHGDRTVMQANWGPAISKNPYFSFKFTGATKGDEITIAWKDNAGEMDSFSTAIK